MPLRTAHLLYYNIVSSTKGEWGVLNNRGIIPSRAAKSQTKALGDVAD